MTIDLPFIQYAFKATGGTSNRTMPDRLADEVNVKDYGALGDGVNDDSGAFQDAFDAAITGGKGVIYIPAGNYLLFSSITWNTDADFGLRVYGAGNATNIVATDAHPVTGYVFDRHLGSPNNTYGPRVFENFRIVNTTTTGGLGGCIRAGSSIGVAVRNIEFVAAGVGFTTEDSAGNSSQSINIDSCHFVSGTGSLSSIGFIMGGSGAIVNTNCEGIGTAALIYGSGISFDGSRCERSNVGWALGKDSAGTDQGLHGFSFTAMEMEGVATNVDIVGTMSGFSIGPISMTGHPAANSGLEGHNADTAYGIRIRANTAVAGEFHGVGVDQYITTGGISIEDYSAPKRAFLTFSNCNPTVGGGGGAPWVNPASSVWPRFIECSGIDASTGPTTGFRYLFANLPASTDLLEGDDYYISDGNTATVGNTVGGSGSNHIHVRWNGTNWICVGG